VKPQVKRASVLPASRRRLGDWPGRGRLFRRVMLREGTGQPFPDCSSGVLSDPNATSAEVPSAGDLQEVVSSMPAACRFTIQGTMDERLLLVGDENRDHLAVLLREGDPAAAEALVAYQSHLVWVGEVHAAGWMSGEEMPSFLQAEAGKQILSQSRRRLIAMAAALMADKVLRVRTEPPYSPVTDIDHLTETLLDRLADRKLPFEPSDAAVFLELVAAYPWLEQLRFGLNAARRVLSAGADRSVLTALERLDAVFLEEPKSLLVSKVMGYHPRVKALLGATNPDPSEVLGTDDAFGPAAIRLIADRHNSWDAVGALALLGSPRGTRASAAWWSEVETRLLETEELGQLVVDLLDLVAAINLTDGSSKVHGFYRADVVLLGDVNTIVVRGAAWAARLVDLPRPEQALGRAGLRCSSLVRGQWAVEPLNSKVAYAAVDSLIACGSEESRKELVLLIGEVQAVPVLRRIAGALDYSESAIRDLVRERRSHRLVHRRDGED
jgi:hypothetical protein